MCGCVVSSRGEFDPVGFACLLKRNKFDEVKRALLLHFLHHVNIDSCEYYKICYNFLSTRSPCTSVVNQGCGGAVYLESWKKEKSMDRQESMDLV